LRSTTSGQDGPVTLRAGLYSTYMKLAERVWSAVHNHQLSIDEGLGMLKEILEEHME
jgi:hypothetical protein